MKYYRGVDAIRFLAALIVALHHVAFVGWIRESGLPLDLLGHRATGVAVASIGWLGWIGVEIFFVISGIVIASSAHERTPYVFAKGRAGRLLPAAVVCSILAGLIVSAAHAPVNHIWLRVLSSMIINPMAGSWIDPVFWTLTVEISFYFVMWLWLIFVGSSFKWLAVGLTVWSGLWWVTSVTGHPIPESVARLSLLRHGCFFAFGMFVWMWSTNRMNVLTWGSFALATALCLSEIYIKALSGRWVDIPAYPWGPVALWAISALAIIASVIFATETRPHRVMRRIGLMTYPLYLCHTTVGLGAAIILFDHGQSAAAATYSGIAVACLASWAISYTETPLRKIVERVIDRAASSVSAARTRNSPAEIANNSGVL